jgi:hypothetical protein
MGFDAPRAMHKAMKKRVLLCQMRLWRDACSDLRRVPGGKPSLAALHTVTIRQQIVETCIADTGELPEVSSQISDKKGYFLT